MNGVEPAAEPPHLISPAELDVPAEGVPAKDAPAAGTVDSLSVEITDSLP